MSVIFWYLFIFLLSLQSYFIAVYFLPLLRPVRRPKRSPIPVSVIICAKNEANNLSSNLPFILNQKYASFEVIVMDDHSTDHTKEVIDEFSRKHEKLRYLRASPEIKDKAGKKWALSEAIPKAAFKHLILTDADCRPGSLDWIEGMASMFSGRTGIVLGIGQYNLSGKWFDNLIQYETLTTAMTYLGMAANGRPYMGVGRNLAYQKRFFDSLLMLEENTASGDDDMFVQKIASGDNTSICTDVRAQTFSDPPSSYKNWLKQKGRHYSTSFHYRTDIKIRLLALKTAFYGPYYMLILLCFLQFYAGLALVILVLRWLIWAFLFRKIKSRLGFTHPLYFLPCYEIYFSLFDLWILAKGLKKKQTTWN